jgi:hypothetical protein
MRLVSSTSRGPAIPEPEPALRRAAHQSSADPGRRRPFARFLNELLVGHVVESVSQSSMVM